MKRFGTLLTVLGLMLTLQGCSFVYGDELLTAPQASKAYQTLEQKLKEVQDTKISTAPISGDNRSTIQLVDLNNDGVDEVISFFRASNNSSQFYAYVHQKTDSDYQLIGEIEGSGTAIQSVSYPLISPDGRRGIFISWERASEGANMLTACSYEEGSGISILLETEYIAMTHVDLTGNGAQDLFLIGTNSLGRRTASLYCYRNQVLELAGEAVTSPEAVTVVSVTSGRLTPYQTAIFAEQKTENGIGLLTDIFVFENETLQNLALDSEGSTGSGTYRSITVSARDINGDGIIEIPHTVLMAGDADASSEDAVFMLDWYQYDANKIPQLVETTYQNVAESWQIKLKAEWHDLISAVKTSENGLTAVHFSKYISDGEPVPIFTIYCATGTLREYYAAKTDIIQLKQTETETFFAVIETELPEDFTITEQELKERFSLVTLAWR